MQYPAKNRYTLNIYAILYTRICVKNNFNAFKCNVRIINKHKFMKKIVMLFALAILFITAPVFAQDDTTATTTDNNDISTETTDVVNTTDEAINNDSIDTGVVVDETATEEDNAVSEEAVLDEVVTEEDLGAQTPGPFHFLKSITRAVQRTITRDPVKKAELRLEEAHEELLRAKKIIQDNPDNAKAAEKAQKAVAKFEKNIEKVQEQAAKIKEKNADQSGAFLEKIADFQVKQQKMLDNLEVQLPPQAYAKVQEARQNSLEHQVQVMTTIAQNQGQLADAISQAFDKQRGSDFKEIKQLEVLDRISEFVPEEARNAIEQAQGAIQQRFEDRINTLPEELRGKKFETYMAQINGSPVQQFRVIDELKSTINVPGDFLDRLENAKENTTSRFEERIRSFDTPEEQDQFLSSIADGSVENLRVIQNIKTSVPEDLRQQIEIKEDEAIQKFKAEFTDNPDAQQRAQKFEELSKKLRENPDAATFAMIQKLRENLPPDQQAFVENLGREAATGFQEQYQADPQTFLKRVESFNPEAIASFQQFQDQAPIVVRSSIGQAISQQIDAVKQRIDTIDDPARFDRIKQQLSDNPEIQQKIEQRYGDITTKLEQKGTELNAVKQRIEAEFNARVVQENAKRAEEGMPDISGNQLENLKQRFMLSPELRIDKEVQTQARENAETKVKQEIKQNIQPANGAQQQPNRGEASSDQNNNIQQPPRNNQQNQLQRAPLPARERVDEKLDEIKAKLDDQSDKNSLDDRRFPLPAQQEKTGDKPSAGTPLPPPGSKSLPPETQFRTDGAIRQGEPVEQEQPDDSRILPPPSTTTQPPPPPPTGSVAPKPAQ